MDKSVVLDKFRSGLKGDRLDVSVIIVTLNRPDCVKRCLDALYIQQPLAEQIIVVDASPDTLTADVVKGYPEVLYLRNDNGFGRMTASRNIGLKRATGKIIAFVDDDAFAHEDWLANLIATYTDETIGMVGGQALNNQPGEESQGVDKIGQIGPNGSIDGNFAANPGRTIEVDHVMGCNMSYRRSVLAKLGGFREDYPGISGLCEDTDMCVRVKRLGYKILFNPEASVDHIGAPQSVGRRFDARWYYFAKRNHTCLLIRNFGLFNPILIRHSFAVAMTAAREVLKKYASSTLIFCATLYGVLAGIAAGISLVLSKGPDPVRHDPAGQEIAAYLANEQNETHLVSMK